MGFNLSAKFLVVTALAIVATIMFFTIEVMDLILARLQSCFKRAVDFVKPFTENIFKTTNAKPDSANIHTNNEPQTIQGVSDDVLSE